MKAKLNTENATSFNSSLKKAIAEATGQKARASIINSHKFPDCYVQIRTDENIPNEFRLKCYDAIRDTREGLLDDKDVCYGNIWSNHITIKVKEWVKVFNQ